MGVKKLIYINGKVGFFFNLFDLHMTNDGQEKSGGKQK